MRFLAFGTLALLLAAPAQAVEQTSPSYRLRGGHLNGGSVGVMLSPGFTVGGTIGQSEALGGSANGVVDLRSVVPGYWPIALIASPAVDADGDGTSAFADNCPFWPNPAQVASLDDPVTGQACLCGDVDDNGTVDAFDVDDFRAHLADPLGFTLVAPQKCTVVGQLGQCRIDNVVVLRRALLALAPFVAQRCEAANGP